MRLYLYSLDKDFKIVRTIEVETTSEAYMIVKQHLEDSEYSNLRTTDDGDYTMRYIADPIKGRKGRNVAALDY